MIAARFKGAETAEDNPFTIAFITFSRGYKIYPAMLENGENLSNVGGL